MIYHPPTTKYMKKMNTMKTPKYTKCSKCGYVGSFESSVVASLYYKQVLFDDRGIVLEEFVNQNTYLSDSIFHCGGCGVEYSYDEFITLERLSV